MNRVNKPSTSDFVEEVQFGIDEATNCKPNRRKKPIFVIADGSKKNQKNAKENESGKRHVGFKYLKELSEKGTSEIISEIMNPDSPFPLFLEKRDLQTEWLFLIVNIASKVCSFEFAKTRNEMINQICRSEFLHSVSHYLGDVSFEKQNTTIEKLPSFVDDLIGFYSSVISFLPTVAVDKDLPKLVAKTKKAVDSMSTDHKLEVNESLLGKLNILAARIEDYKKILEKPPKPVQKRSYLQYLSEQSPPDDFRELDLYPTYEDLTRGHFGFVRPNKIRGAYDDEEHYLDVQFRLLREDFIDSLRRGLKQYLEAKSNPSQGKKKFKYESMRLYPECQFLEVKKTERNQFAYLLNFDPKRRIKIKWEYSKRFMYGSLLLFTSDDFSTFFYGTVADRNIELLSKGQILVTFPNDVQTEKNLLSKKYLMAESEVFFEPYFLVMKSLKSLNAENFPMAKYIVRGESNTDFPSYMREDMVWDVYHFRVDPFVNETWPTPRELGLDVHQHQAFQKALTSDFCVIQGPPGTGKTFIGLKIVEVLLHNITLSPMLIRRPLLIVCYTNHALDQFLEGILGYTDKIIRIGAQSRSEVLKNYNLRGRNQQSIRRSEAARQQLGPVLQNIRSQIQNNMNVMNRLTEQKSRLEERKGILKYDIIRSVMTEDQKKLLTDGKFLLNWLLESEDENHSDSTTRRKGMNSGSKSDEPATETTNAEGMGTDEVEPEFEEENEEDYHLVDEDDTFETNSATKESLKCDFQYEITVVELDTKCSDLFENLNYIRELSDEEIEDYADHFNNVQALEMEFNIVSRRLQILTEQLNNPYFTIELIERISKKDLHHLTLQERWVLYWSWVRDLRENIIKQLQEAEEIFRSSMSQFEDVKQMEDLFVVERVDVVGMTTTCAARLNTLLSALKPAIGKWFVFI